MFWSHSIQSDYIVEINVMFQFDQIRCFVVDLDQNWSFVSLLQFWKETNKYSDLSIISSFGSVYCSLNFLLFEQKAHWWWNMVLSHLWVHNKCPCLNCIASFVKFKGVSSFHHDITKINCFVWHFWKCNDFWCWISVKGRNVLYW